MFWRRTLKVLHTLSACGIIGALFGYMILLVWAPQDGPRAYADLRQSISLICDYLLLPSLGIALISGLLAMAAHRPYMEKRWVWVKALLGLSMFEATLAIVGGKADYAAKIAQQIADGADKADSLARALSYEWWTLWTIMALSLANIVLAIWRPRLKRRKAASS